jgi:hypothetical protein
MESFFVFLAKDWIFPLENNMPNQKHFYILQIISLVIGLIFGMVVTAFLFKLLT